MPYFPANRRLIEGSTTVPDRETIETTLHRVRSGELSPDAATELLLAAELGGDAAKAEGFESLASLIGRLGNPPAEIIETWCRQMRGIARKHEERTGNPLPSIDIEQWSITPAGQLIWQLETATTADTAEPPEAASLQVIDQFRKHLISDSASPKESANDEPPIASIEVTDDVSNRPIGAAETSAESPPQPNARRWSPVLRAGMWVGLLAVIAPIGWFAYRSLRGNSEMASNIDAAAPGLTSGALEILPEASDADPSIALETIDSLSVAELPIAESLEFDLTVPLEQLMPLAVESKLAANKDPDSVAQPSDGQQDPDAIPLLASDDDPDRDAPDESPQATRTATTSAVTLHGVDDAGEATQLPLAHLKGMKLEFPFAAPLELRGDESKWLIHDSRSGSPVASIQMDSGAALLRWTEEAKASAASSSLFHGRIRNGDDQAVYLRPQIEADPWPIRLDQADVLPIWNLQYPMPPRAARIEVGFELPEQIEQAWIEPIESDALRRCRGIAVLTPRDGETVSLGVRFDIRCSKKLTCRIRYAGRLDPSLPWQPVSVEMLEQLAGQLADQAAAVSAESSRLDRVYQIADTAGRRILRVKRDRTDQLAEMVAATSERVVELQKLIAALESSGRVKLRVWVEWPETTQDLLAMQQMEKEMEDGE